MLNFLKAHAATTLVLAGLFGFALYKRFFIPTNKLDHRIQTRVICGDISDVPFGIIPAKNARDSEEDLEEKEKEIGNNDSESINFSLDNNNKIDKEDHQATNKEVSEQIISDVKKTSSIVTSIESLLTSENNEGADSEEIEVEMENDTPISSQALFQIHPPSSKKSTLNHEILKNNSDSGNSKRKTAEKLTITTEVSGAQVSSNLDGDDKIEFRVNNKLFSKSSADNLDFEVIKEREVIDSCRGEKGSTDINSRIIAYDSSEEDEYNKRTENYEMDSSIEVLYSYPNPLYDHSEDEKIYQTINFEHQTAEGKNE